MAARKIVKIKNDEIGEITNRLDIVTAMKVADKGVTI